jgi:hypothetical protein
MIFSFFLRNKEDYIKYIKWVIEKIRERKLKLKLFKYEFFKEEVTFLESIIKKNGIRVDLNKIRVILKWLIFKKLKDL